jgi:hypothetical protein
MKVAVYDASLVCRLQAGSNLSGEGHHLWNSQALIAQDRRQIRALDVRHRDVLDAVEFSEIVDAHDVLVGDLPCEQQLLFETPLDVLCRRGVARHLGSNHFERHRHAELVVPGLVHRAHAANAELPQDAVPRPERLTVLEWPTHSFLRRADRTRGGDSVASENGFSVVLRRRSGEEDGFVVIDRDRCDEAGVHRCWQQRLACAAANALHRCLAPATRALHGKARVLKTNE